MQNKLETKRFQEGVRQHIKVNFPLCFADMQNTNECGNKKNPCISCVFNYFNDNGVEIFLSEDESSRGIRYLFKIVINGREDKYGNYGLKVETNAALCGVSLAAEYIESLIKNKL